MLARRTAPAAYWEQVGRQALEQGVEKIVMMGAREYAPSSSLTSDWETLDDTIRVSANPNPPKQPVAW